jgi:hypothetical protein
VVVVPCIMIRRQYSASMLCRYPPAIGDPFATAPSSRA